VSIAPGQRRDPAQVGHRISTGTTPSEIRRSTHDDHLGAVYSVHEAVRAICIVVGSAIVAAAIEAAGSQLALIEAGVVLLVAAAAGESVRGREAAATTRVPRAAARPSGRA
jgi:hypothetical protein